MRRGSVKIHTERRWTRDGLAVYRARFDGHPEACAEATSQAEVIGKLILANQGMARIIVTPMVTKDIVDPTAAG